MRSETTTKDARPTRAPSLERRTRALADEAASLSLAALRLAREAAELARPVSTEASRLVRRD